MKDLAEKLPKAHFADGVIYVDFPHGKTLSFPVAENPILAKGTPQQLANVRISRTGLHWADLDEDLSFAGLVNGDFGQI